MRLPLLQTARADVEPRRGRSTVDGAGLERALRGSVEGEIRFDAATRAAYSTDASNYRRVPTGVVIPRSVDDVVATVAACREHGVPLVSRGGGTSLNGQCCTHGVVIDCSKYLTRIVEIDPERRMARVQPGLVRDELCSVTKDRHDLTFGPDPSTHSHCTFGGMIGNNSCGAHSVMAGRSSDNVVEMEVLTSDGVRLRVGETLEPRLEKLAARSGRVGEIYRGLRAIRADFADEIRRGFPDIPRRVSGYNLPDLLGERRCNVARALVGSEGTCVAVLEATVRLVHWPRCRSLLILGYPDVYETGDHIPAVLEARPTAVEGMDDRLIQYTTLRGLHDDDMRLLTRGGGWLLVEFGGESREEADGRARELMDRLAKEPSPPEMELVDEPGRQQRIWEVRESGLGATAFVPGKPDAWPGWEDAAVDPAQIGPYLRDFRKLLREFGYDCALYGHFGQGCIHCRINFDLVTRPGIDHYREFVGRAADLVLEHHGSLSAEHGDGMSKSELLPRMYGPRIMEAFARFKRLWDPDGIMNPGKIVDAGPVEADLKLGTNYRPEPADTMMRYGDSGPWGFQRETIRCAGVGKCRRRHDAFMCPSYVATQDELHTTRGRARALFEMMRGDFIDDGWRSAAVLQSLDLCLACKGCKKECPVSVDMASYKAEFLYHHYRRRLRPREFYAMGHIGALADLAAVAPKVANAVGQGPLAGLAKRIAGVAPDRDLPRLARRTFQSWFRSRPDPGHAEGARLLLLPDAFNDHFFPETLRAATLSLEALGFRVELPRERYPALRPLVHYGFLAHARRHLDRFLSHLDGYARQGMMIIGLEPSEVSIFRDEAERFFPEDPRVDRVRIATLLLSEFVTGHVQARLPTLEGPCLFHAHCHQKASLDADAARELLRRLGLDPAEPEPGCCGMAGAFGFEAEHADLSRKIGEENLLPAVRALEPGGWVVTEGFSCREQIAQDTDRQPRHISELLAEALGVSEARDPAAAR